MDDGSLQKNGVIYGTMKRADKVKAMKEIKDRDRMKTRLQEDFGIDFDDKFVFDQKLLDDLKTRTYEFIKI